MSGMESGKGPRRTRRRFSEEFKTGAVRLVLDEGRTVGAVARELDLTASALSLWVKHALAERTKGKSGLMKEEREELARLRKENRILAEERDILKNHRARRVPRYLLDQKLCSYYERSRTYLALDKDTPIPRPVTPREDAAVVAIPEVGGLHHRYERRAA